ncbi:hypothetical protein AMTR_s00040p00208180 [Amborella trichopoda]|uniref:Uncharacterized protein n=1 Tax=Amborella trichopoda TaxID=13333 RepID=W1PZZ3_AMBTC|nr:hypothetical protein AMTR_s00040p00208180 [Amborella trichopoda]
MSVDEEWVFGPCLKAVYFLQMRWPYSMKIGFLHLGGGPRQKSWVAGQNL